LGGSNEYSRVLYRHGGLRLVPDHYRIDGRWGVVSMIDSAGRTEALASTFGRTYGAGRSTRRSAWSVNGRWKDFASPRFADMILAVR
jgi:hypothetical protein